MEIVFPTVEKDSMLMKIRLANPALKIVKSVLKKNAYNVLITKLSSKIQTVLIIVQMDMLDQEIPVSNVIHKKTVKNAKLMTYVSAHNVTQVKYYTKENV
jgi:hypothetical protein